MPDEDNKPAFHFEPSYFTGEETLAYVISITWFHDQNYPLWEYLNEEIEGAKSDYLEAKHSGDTKDELARLENNITEKRELATLAQLRKNDIEHEVGLIRNNRASRLVISQDNDSFSLIRFTKLSVYQWAQSKYNIFPLSSPTSKSTARPAAAHYTPLLDVLHTAIEELWLPPNYDPDRPPTNEAIVAWMKEKYPNSNKIGLSAKVIDVMCKIMRPPNQE